MITFGNRRDGNPIILKSDSSITKPKRVLFTEKMFDEGWLQRHIEANPELLPIGDIEPVFSPAVSIGLEVETSVGPIDNLFISPQGYLTIVETKLWRNPEARRQVVGQIIDYAKDISTWSYEHLDNKVREYSNKRNANNKGILDIIEDLQDIDEIEKRNIVDTISRNLQKGRFLLLIVGDGIRESVEAMVDFLQKTPQLLFTLALLELQVYELEGDGAGSFLIIPQIVVRTREITRAVVRVEGRNIESVHIEVDTEVKAPEGKSSVRHTITEDAYFKALGERVNAEDVAFARQLKEDLEKIGCIIDWMQASYVVKLRDPGESGKKLSLLVVPTDGYTYIRWELGSQLHSVGLPKEIAADWARESVNIFPNCEEDGCGGWTRNIPLSELREHYSAFTALVQKTINRIREEAQKITSE